MDEKKQDRRIFLVQDRDGLTERTFVLDGVYTRAELAAAIGRIIDYLPDGRTVEVCRVAGTAQCPKSLADLVLCVATGDSEARKADARKAG